MKHFTFFGSSRFSVIALDELERAGLIPTTIITTPDKPQGRKMTMTPTPVKQWATSRNIRVYDPAKLSPDSIGAIKTPLFIVASYGKIIPQAVLDLPAQGTLNIHPSLLPKYRGASPLQSAMLDDAKDTGVTIMQIDADMDHGPIIAQEKVHVDEWPIYEKFEEMMAQKGAQLLARIMPDWTDGKIKAIAQDHAAATFTKKTKKEDGEIPSPTDQAADQYLSFRKIQAFHEWPQAYFFIEHNGKKIRVKVTQASWKSDVVASAGGAPKLIIEKVIPEGSKEMPYEDFVRGYRH